MIADKVVDQLFGPTFGAMIKKLGLPSNLEASMPKSKERS